MRAKSLIAYVATDNGCLKPAERPAIASHNAAAPFVTVPNFYPDKIVIFDRLACSRKETALFAVDWLKGGIPIEKETCVLAGQGEAIAAAKLAPLMWPSATSGENPTVFV